MALTESRSALIEALDPTPVGTHVIPEPPPIHQRGLRTAVKPTHPDCQDCCGRRLCHWCLQPGGQTATGQDAYVMRQWTDGYWYGACRDHARYLEAAVDGRVAPDVSLAGAV